MRKGVVAALLCLLSSTAPAAMLQETILFGVAYYDEYTPTDRVAEDAQLMKAAGINVVRIAESTWATLEHSPGQFDFTHIDRVLNAMGKVGIKVIIGTPTYAVPNWLARDKPNVMAVTPAGPSKFGARRNMDYSDHDFREAAQRVIVALVDHVRDNPAVIGYQIDNETESAYNTGPAVQAAFVAALRKKYPDIEKLNKDFGLDYWSNRINDWADFPSVNGSINASMLNAFAEFQRGLLTEYHAWQAGLVRAHAKPGQFITHNYELDWRGYSFGVNREANFWEAAKPLDVAGIDIYHPGQDRLTGAEIAFGGDMGRSMRDGQNYFVIETQAQGFPEWTPYPGQLRLQAFSHIASGANMVSYWHWATTANAIETYWRGVLAQDYQKNAVYDEVRSIGEDLKRLGSVLVNMRKRNRVAIYVSNTALSAFDQFPIKSGGTNVQYNDVVRQFYDALYRINIEVDIISPSSQMSLSEYKLIIVPSLYAASYDEIAKLNAFAKAGGHLFYTFKSGFSDENTKVRYATQPGGIAEAAGIRYNQFTYPENVTLDGDPFSVGVQANEARWWMELLIPSTATVVARYQHSSWPSYAAMTRNSYGGGEVTYLGFMPTEALTEKILLDTAKRAGVETAALHFPLIVRSGILQDGRRIHYLFNYSKITQTVLYTYERGVDLFSKKTIANGATLEIGPWGIEAIAESKVSRLSSQQK